MILLGQLLTSSNYDDQDKKVTGGRNGFGAKLANIFSTEFIVETGDRNARMTYKQVFTANMSCKGEPQIEKKVRTENFTKVSFKPDLAKFKMQNLDEDIVALMTKRVYDIAGITPVKVQFNGKLVSVNSFPKYVDLYLETKEHRDLPKITQERSDRW